MHVESLTFFNFAYGSNMSSTRLRARVPSARVIGRAALHGYQLVWDKVGTDGSGKCDVVASGAPDAVVHGVVYAIAQSEKPALDRAEGLGNGYDERQVVIEVNGTPHVATMYYATRKDAALKPYSWYKAHVLAGASEHELPPAYITALEAAEAMQDPDASRHELETRRSIPASRAIGTLTKDRPELTTGSQSVPTIYKLTIQSFRGIKDLTWRPAPGVNLILGGGDVGKTTILDAISLLLSPTNSASVLDSDYNLRDEEAEFSIEAVMALPSGGGINHLTKPSWPWNWDGRDAVVPAHDDESGETASEEVYVLRVRGTADLELSYEIVQPSGITETLPVSFRRKIGLVRLSGDDRNDRDLRLVQGSALDRLLTDKGLRSRMARKLAENDVWSELSDDARKALSDLDDAFRKRKLPDDLDIAVTGGQGPSIASLVGLTAKRQTVQLPLSSWGAGTRRLSALAIAEQIQGGNPITVVDEVERGLEPYRQRILMARLQGVTSQAFITTHSPAVISAGAKASLWYLDQTGRLGKLAGAKVARLRATDPDSFLARLTVVAEGITEVGFVRSLLAKALSSELQPLGFHVADGGGHDTTIELLESLSEGGMQFGGFADNENRHPTRWADVQKQLGPLLFRWKSGDIESNLVDSLADHQIETFITDPDDERTGRRLRSLAMRLKIEQKDFASIKAAAGSEFKRFIKEAAGGKVPEGTLEAEKKTYSKQTQDWFKTERGGSELAGKLFGLGVWPALKVQLLPFCNAVRAVAGLPALEDLLP
jgi:putative ATP-dependent endonuclease of OLD family